MTIIYSVPKVISIDGIVINFNEERETIRRKLGNDYREDNQVIALGEDNSDVIYQRRDIFKSLNFTGYYFFLIYNKKDLLNELEVHNCSMLQVNDFKFGFNDELNYVASELAKYSSVRKIDEGEYFFKEIKVSIMDKNKMGGEGSSLGYFYCSEDVSHLDF